MTMVEDRYYSDDVVADIIEKDNKAGRIVPVAPGSVEDACGKLLQTSAIFIVATVNAHLDEQQAELVRYFISSGLPSRSDDGAVPFVPTDRAAVATQWRWRNGQDTVARSAFPTGTRSILPSRSDDGVAVPPSPFPTGTSSILPIIATPVP